VKSLTLLAEGPLGYRSVGLSQLTVGGLVSGNARVIKGRTIRNPTGAGFQGPSNSSDLQTPDDKVNRPLIPALRGRRSRLIVFLLPPAGGSTFLFGAAGRA